MKIDLSLEYDDEAHYSSKGKKQHKKVPAKPIHLEEGKVVAVAGNLIELEQGGIRYKCSIKGNLKKTGNDKTLFVIGDIVQFDVKQKLIHAIEPRKNTLFRKNQLTGQRQIFCANTDQVFIVCSVSSPLLKPSLIDRYLIAAAVGGIKPIIVINKIDLLENQSDEVHDLYNWVKKTYLAMNLDVLEVSAATNHNIELLKKHMSGKVSFFTGQSGVGKTSLINRLCASDFAVNPVHQKTDKGVHTTTRSSLITMDTKTYCIDSPGIKSFALFDLKLEEIQTHFNDLQRYASSCRYSNCRHIQEKECGVKKALDLGNVDPRRIASYKKLVEEYEQNQANPSPRNP